jgi:predicted DNA-binding protein YlxM (UPF0122 family)
MGTRGRPSLVTDEQQAQVVALYQEGLKLREIEERTGVTRSQLYWILEQNKVAPSRVKRRSRLDDGNAVSMKRLYEIMHAQDERIQQLEAALNLILQSPDDAQLVRMVAFGALGVGPNGNVDPQPDAS